jgi:hypothetical protein
MLIFWQKIFRVKWLHLLAELHTISGILNNARLYQNHIGFSFMVMILLNFITILGV